MKSLLSLTIVILSYLLNTSVWADDNTEAKIDSTNWPQQMQKMSIAINQLIPFTYSQKAFHDTNNQQKISDTIDALKNAIHTLPDANSEKIVGKDPLINTSLKQLDDDLTRAALNFKQGKLEYSRALLSGVVDHCFRCHTRSEFGPEYFKAPSELENVTLSLSEQADLYVATRQYEKALRALRKNLTGPINVFEDQFDLERSLKKYLAIVVRIKNDPEQGIKTLEMYRKRENIPFYLQEDISQWIVSLTEWSKEKPKEASFATGQALIDEGNQLQKESGSQRGYIEYLRGSSMLHDFLRAPEVKNTDYANIYLALGQSYEVITSLGLWELPEIYYEACVRQSPKSSVAKQCYELYERNIFMGYSGSGGTYIPIDEKARLNQLCELAGVKSTCYEES